MFVIEKEKKKSKKEKAERDWGRRKGAGSRWKGGRMNVVRRREEREETAEILGRHEAPIILSWTASSSPRTVAHCPAADFGIRGGGRRRGIVEDPLSAESIMI